MTELWQSKVTIYNDIPATLAETRHFDRFVVGRCQIQGGFITRENGTIQNVVNAKTVITRDVNRYKTPNDYSLIPVDMRNDFFTVRVGDFIVFGEVDDIVTTAAEFSDLQQKYKDNGIKIVSVSVSINDMNVDNISMTNA